MEIIIKYIFNVIITILLICYIIYATDTRNKKHEYLDMIIRNKIYRMLILLIIVFSSIDGSYILALLLSISYINSINLIKN